VIGFVLTTCVASGLWASDARTKYLINMLENGRNYRLKVQAATTLGKLRSKDAVPALVIALKDEHELVVISAATALEQIGDTSTIGPIELALAKAKSTAVKSQLQSTLRVLRALSVDGKQPGISAEAVSTEPQFLIRVDPMGNSSGVVHEDITEMLRAEVIERVSREPGVVMQGQGLSAEEVNEKIKREKLGAYILSGAILKIERADDRIIIRIGLNVFTNPSYNLLMMPTAQGMVQVAPGDTSQESERKARERAMKSVVSSLVTTVFDELRQLKRP